MSISVWGTKVSMLSSLLLANIRILSCFFFLFLAMLSNFLIIPVVREKIKVKLALAIPTGAPTTLADEMIQTPLLVALRLVFSRFFDIRVNLGNVKEKPTRKTYFSREMKRLVLRIYLAKFC